MRRSYTLNINLTNVGFVKDRSGGVLTETIMSGVSTTLCHIQLWSTADVEKSLGKTGGRVGHWSREAYQKLSFLNFK